mmetsp:Transcript_11760/g.26240  ORF Transcript_11760/g.26240 Transcript_11760/m.26240 type:complete len:253 (-) Transcript_11760:271-1029(-)
MPVPGVELAVCTVMGAAQAGCRVVDYIEKIKATHQAEKRALLLRARRSDVLEENVRSLERRMADHNLIKDLNMKLEALGKQYDQSRSEVSGLESRINELLEKCATLKLQNEEREAVSKPVLEVKLGASPGRQRGEAPEEAKAKFMAVQMDSVDYAGAIRQLRERANPASQIKSFSTLAYLAMGFALFSELLYVASNPAKSVLRQWRQPASSSSSSVCSRTDRTEESAERSWRSTLHDFFAPCGKRNVMTKLE